jgi:hypothetical protein
MAGSGMLDHSNIVGMIPPFYRGYFAVILRLF